MTVQAGAWQGGTRGSGKSVGAAVLGAVLTLLIFVAVFVSFLIAPLALLLVAVANRNRPINKLRRMMGEHFEREILADLEYRMSWINTVVKTAPMLGLLGTVTGMIAAFGKIAGASKTGADPSALAGDISFALFTTAMGLMIAVPLVMLGAWLQVRIGKLQDEVQQYLGVFLEDFEAAVMKAGRR